MRNLMIDIASLCGHHTSRRLTGAVTEDQRITQPFGGETTSIHDGEQVGLVTGGAEAVGRLISRWP